MQAHEHPNHDQSGEGGADGRGVNCGGGTADGSEGVSISVQGLVPKKLSTQVLVTEKMVRVCRQIAKVGNLR